MSDKLIYWGVAILCLAISLAVSFLMNASLHKKHPEVKSYVWGYFIGCVGMLSLTVTGVLLIVDASNNYGIRSDKYEAFGIVALMAAIVHFFILKRSKWAFIIGTLIQLNPILWIINGLYLKNRWSELAGLPIEQVSNKFKNASSSTRVILVGSGLWALACVTLLFTLEPFGSYVTRREWTLALTILVLPPVIIVAVYFLYSKLFKQSHQKSV